MDQNIPAVSIVIPVFNVEKYIGKCLDSLISQTLHNIEIICVNDCSTDKSLDILRDYEAKDNRIVVIDLPRNIKQGGARNVGIKKARAPFLGFGDSDDWVSLDMYENLYTLAVTHDAEMVCGDYFQYYSEQDIRLRINCKPEWFSLPEHERNKRFIEGECRIWTNIIKKEVFIRNKIEFPEELFYEDNAIVTALYLSARKIVKDTHPYYYYRCNNISTTRSINNYRFFDRLKTSKMFLDNMRRLGIYEIYPEEVEFRFTELFYVNSILGAISQFDPPEKKYVNQIKREMEVIFPCFMKNSYYKTKVPLKLRILLRAIYFQTDLGISLYQILVKLRS